MAAEERTEEEIVFEQVTQQSRKQEQLIAPMK